MKWGYPHIFEERTDYGKVHFTTSGHDGGCCAGNLLYRIYHHEFDTGKSGAADSGTECFTGAGCETGSGTGLKRAIFRALF